MADPEDPWKAYQKQVDDLQDDDAFGATIDPSRYGRTVSAVPQVAAVAPPAPPTWVTPVPVPKFDLRSLSRQPGWSAGGDAPLAGGTLSGSVGLKGVRPTDVRAAYTRRY
jgi:hypothetical protein